MSASLTFAPAPPIRVAGSPAAGAVFDVRSVVGPNPYATGGIPIDLSAAYSTLHSVQLMRAYVTATKQGTGRIFEVVETGTDTFGNRKLRVVVLNPRAAHTPTGTNSAPTFAGDALGTHIHAAVSAGTPAGTVSAPFFQGALATTSAPIASADCIVGCSNNHPDLAVLTYTPSGTNTAPTFTGSALGTHQHAAVSAGTPAGSVSAPTFTGDAVAAAVAEEIGALDLSGVTLEFLVIGVPA